MKKIIISLIFINLLTVYSFAAGHITKVQKEKAIECLGHYTASAVLPADKVEVKDIEISVLPGDAFRVRIEKEAG